MLQDIGTVDRVPEFLEAVKRKEKRLMGFGHRVYKAYDPRAKICRDILEQVFTICGQEPLLHVARALEEAALKDDYFVSRRLYPNVDFYTGLIYKAMGFPSDFFPLLFAIPRIVGWLAHWREMLLEQRTPTGDSMVRIWRPRQVYTGPRVARFVPMAERRPPSPDDTTLNSDRQILYKRYFISKQHRSQ
jgi:citrate synthase